MEGISSLGIEVICKCSEEVREYFPDKSSSTSDVTMKELLPHKTLSFEIAMLIS